MVDLQGAYAACARDAAGHYENFPVASWLIPRALRRHVAAVYAFARAADDFADEEARAPDERDRLLDGWLRRLRAAARNLEPAPVSPGEPAHSVEIFVAVGATIRELRLPLTLFEDLIGAFRQDVTVTRYRSWEELLDYCRRSANPVGRLVLRIAGYDDPVLDAQSDAICTALQLANFWQDVENDWARGRVYVPDEVLQAHGARIDDLGRGPLPSSWRRALEDVTARTRALFAAGRPLCDAVRGRLRYELRATWLGGARILQRLEGAGFDPFVRRPRLRLTDAPWLAWHLCAWRVTR